MNQLKESLENLKIHLDESVSVADCRNAIRGLININKQLVNKVNELEAVCKNQVMYLSTMEKLHSEPDEEIKIIQDFANKIVNQENIKPEIQDAVNKGFWDMIQQPKPTETKGCKLCLFNSGYCWLSELTKGLAGGHKCINVCGENKEYLHFTPKKSQEQQKAIEKAEV